MPGAVYGVPRPNIIRARVLQSAANGGSGGSIAATLGTTPRTDTLQFALTGRQATVTDICTVTSTNVVWTRLASYTSGSGEVEIHVGLPTGSGTPGTTVTATFSSGAWPSLGVIEVNNQGLVQGRIRVQQNTGYGTVPWSGTSFQPGSAKLQVMVCKNNAGGGANMAIPSGWVTVAQDTDFMVAYLIPAQNALPGVTAGTASAGACIVASIY